VPALPVVAQRELTCVRVVGYVHLWAHSHEGRGHSRLSHHGYAQVTRERRPRGSAQIEQGSGGRRQRQLLLGQGSGKAQDDCCDAFHNHRSEIFAVDRAAVKAFEAAEVLIILGLISPVSMPLQVHLVKLSGG
jgi:hypothetical protein